MGTGAAAKRERELRAVDAKAATPIVSRAVSASASTYARPPAVLHSPSADAGPEPVALTPREHEITRLVAKGLPNKTIAGVLDMSPYTVATHLRRVFAKLGVNSRAAMVARLFELNHARPAGTW